MRAAIYARISRDDAGDMLGVRRQEKDARALCSRKGWTVDDRHVFVDDDVSAWSGRERPEYRRMLAAISTREVDAVVAYDLDRLHRLPRELESFFETCDAAGLTKMATVAGEHDLADSSGRLVARIMGAVAKKSSDDTSRRLKRKFDEKAELGQPHGGRAFGYDPDGVTVRISEAELLQEAARDVLAGESLAEIARRWNALGVLTPQRRRQWSSTVVRAVLTNPRHAGLRVHRGEVVGKAAWPAVLDRTTHERLVAMLKDARRRQSNPPRRTPFTTLVRCSLCGAPMTRDLVGKLPTYRCHRKPGREGCGRTSISALPLEAAVVEAVLTRFDTAALARGLARQEVPDEEGAIAELAALDQRQAELAEMYAAGEIKTSTWMTTIKAIEQRQASVRASLTRQRRAPILDEFAGRPGALRAEWPSMTPDRQRALLAAVLDRVSVKPATRRGPIFDGQRVDPKWHEWA